MFNAFDIYLIGMFTVYSAIKSYYWIKNESDLYYLLDSSTSLSFSLLSQQNIIVDNNHRNITL